MSLWGVDNLWECSLSIGGKDYPATSTNLVEYMWFESVHQALPSLNLTFKDYTGEYASIAAAGDGVIIDTTVGDGKTGSTTGKFNIQGPPKISPGNGCYLVKVNAVADAIEYNRKIPSGLYEGTSQSVISRLASEVGLTPIAETATNDSQVWLPNNNTVFNFVKSIAAHAYVGDSSAMVVGVTDQKQLVYGDANQLIKSTSGLTFGYKPEEGEIPIQDWEATSNGVVSNNFKAYGATTNFWSAEGILQELNKVSATLFGGTFGFSLGNASRLGDLGARIDTKPRPAGNTHDKYNEAEHINSRTRAMWNIDLNLVTYHWTNMRLLQSAYCHPQSHGLPGAAEMVTGTLLLTARTKCLFNSKYVERLTFTTNGAS